MVLDHSVASRCSQKLRVTNNDNKKRPRAPFRLTIQWDPPTHLSVNFFRKAPFFLSAPPCVLPSSLSPSPPGEAEVPEGQRGQRSPPAWPGATRTASCQEPSVSRCPPQGNPNKVTSPSESILPFKARLCLEPRTFLWLHEEFIQPFTDTVSIKGAHPGPSAPALMGRPSLDPE